MQTRCPKCNTLYNLRTVDLEFADGLVQCGLCEHIFNARRRLLEEQTGKQADLFSTFEDQPATIPQHPNDSKILRDTLLGKPSRSTLADFGWLCGITILGFGLIAQWLYIDRDRLVQHPVLGEYIASTCGLIPTCDLSPKRDLSKIELLSRNIYTHPNLENVLMLNAVLSNAAAYPQPFPVLLVSMSDIRGKVVAQRYFQPHEYLPEQVSSDSVMPVGSTTLVNMEILDPGGNALAFELDFF